MIGIECDGFIDVEKIRTRGAEGILSAINDGENVVVKTVYGDKTFLREDMLLEKCRACKGKKHMVFDELIGEEKDDAPRPRFTMVEKLEKMTEEERFAFWKKELSKCIRCNACRNVCPACSCVNCVFDNPESGVAAKSNADSFEEKLYHVIRAWHVAGRCTDCGECSRVCPQGIPLHLINRKFIKDMNEFYGEYQAGVNIEENAPLNSYKISDREPKDFDRKE